MAEAIAGASDGKEGKAESKEGEGKAAEAKDESKEDGRLSARPALVGIYGGSASGYFYGPGECLWWWWWG